MFKNTPIYVKATLPLRRLTIRYSIEKPFVKLLEGLTKGFVDMVKCKDFHYILSMSTRCWNGSEHLKVVIKISYR